MKERLLRLLYILNPFNIQGDLFQTPSDSGRLVSCLICSRPGSPDVEWLCHDLAGQTMDRRDFEVIVFHNGELNGKTKFLENRFRDRLNIREIGHLPAVPLGRARNLCLKEAHGRFVLVLDDDTRLLQNDFLSLAVRIFEQEDIDAILPAGKARYGLWRQRYDFLDEFSLASRCILYRRKRLVDIGGYIDTLPTYEDIDLGLRLTIQGIEVLRTNRLWYAHPPLFYATMHKPVVLGSALRRLRRRYSLSVWFLVCVNALRFIPFVLWPVRKNVERAKMSLGILAGLIKPTSALYGERL